MRADTAPRRGAAFPGRAEREPLGLSGRLHGNTRLQRRDAMRRTLVTLAAIALSLMLAQTPAAACAGLIGSNGAVNLGRTTTLAAYHNGIEHYVTAFQFLGGGGQ